MNKGIKFDADKIRMDLLSFDALEEVAKVLTFGAKKYEDNSWQNVDNAAHMATNALFILWFKIQKEKQNGKNI